VIFEISIRFVQSDFFGFERKIMSKLLLDESPLVILPSLAVKIGLNEAIFIQQVHYWLNKSNNIINNQKWVYKTRQEWQQEFPFWSEATIKRVIAKLKKSGILFVEQLSKDKRDRVSYYSINYEVLNSPLGQNDTMEEKKEPTSEPMHRVNMTQSHEVNLTQCIYNENQETTTETTTENTKKINKKKFEEKASKSKTLNSSKKMRWVDVGEDRKELIVQKLLEVQSPLLSVDEFIMSLEAKGYQYVNFVSAYKQWVKRAESNKNSSANGNRNIPKLNQLPKAEEYTISEEW